MKVSVLDPIRIGALIDDVMREHVAPTIAALLSENRQGTAACIHCQRAREEKPKPEEPAA